MIPFDSVLEQQAQGNSAAACETALQHAKESPDSLETAKQAFVFIVSNSYFDYFERAFLAIAPHIDSLLKDPSLYLPIGYAATVKQYSELAETCLKKAILHDPKNGPAYRMLALEYLQNQRGEDAYFLYHACKSLNEGENPLQHWQSVIEFTAKGITTVNFELDGETYAFGLSCFNGQAVESDTYHCNGQLTELQELRFLKAWLPRHRRIVECGCLVGNHTVYFLKNFHPESITIYDADARSLNEMTRNVQLNARPEMDTVINCHHRAISSQSGQTIELFGSSVETITLEEAISEDADFVKIDVDGAERDVLDQLLAGLSRSQAYLMIEVNNDHVPAYKARLGEIGYRLAHAIARSNYQNLFFEPREG